MRLKWLLDKDEDRIKALKVLVEIEIWVFDGSLFHSQVQEGKKELNDEVSFVCLGVSIWVLRRL